MNKTQKTLPDWIFKDHRHRAFVARNRPRCLNISPRTLHISDGMEIATVINAEEDKGFQLKNGSVSAKWLRENTRTVRSYHDQ